MVNLKLKKSLAKENYVSNLVIKGTCQVKEIIDYENQKNKSAANSRFNEFYRTRNSRKQIHKKR